MSSTGNTPRHIFTHRQTFCVECTVAHLQWCYSLTENWIKRISGFHSFTEQSVMQHYISSSANKYELHGQTFQQNFLTQFRTHS